MLEFDPHVLDEKPVPPPVEFSGRAHVKSLEQYREMYAAAEKDPEGFWREQSEKLIDWFKAAVVAPDVKAKLVAQALYPNPKCGADFDAYLRRQAELYARLMHDLDFKVE